MKILSKVFLSALTLVAALAAPLSLSAQQPASERPARPGPGQRGDRLAMMSEQLQLTDDQKTKLKPIVEAEMAAMMALRDDTSLTQEARREKMRELRQSHAEQIRAVLTPEQQTKLAQMRGPGGRGGPGGPGGGEGKANRQRPGGEPKN